jgi:hypothetical protein
VFKKNCGEQKKAFKKCGKQKTLKIVGKKLFFIKKK